MAFFDPNSGGFGSSDNPDLSNPWKQNRYEQWKRGEGEFAGLGGGQASPEQMAQQMIDAMMAPFQQAFDRAKQYEKDNPFFFDEQMARASSQERYDPYYNAELTDFVTGIERRRQASTQDERRILEEITADTESYMGRSKKNLDEAIRASEQGFAGAGLFFSGERQRRTGSLEVEAGQQQRDYLRGQAYQGETATLGKQRTLADLASTEATGRRRQTAERETALLTDIGQQEKEAKAKYELERQQFIGYPLSGGSQSFTNLAQYI